MPACARILRWSLTTLAITIAAAWIATSCRWCAFASWQGHCIAHVNDAGLTVRSAHWGDVYLDTPTFWRIWRSHPPGTPRLATIQNLHDNPGGPTGPDWQIAILFWAALTTLTLPAAALWTITHRHHRRARTAHCPTCNYPRTGLPSKAPCPECGKTPKPLP